MTATYRGAAIKGPMDFTRLVENILGWDPGPDPLRGHIRAASLVKRRVATNPGLYTWHNLALAVEWCRQKQVDVKAPGGVFYYVERALRAAAENPAPESAVEAAIAYELQQQRDGWRDWVRRLDTARGQSRAEVLREWRAERETV